MLSITIVLFNWIERVRESNSLEASWVPKERVNNAALWLYVCRANHTGRSELQRVFGGIGELHGGE